MKRFFGHALSVIVIGLATSAALPACAENDQTIFIRHVLAPPTTRTNNVCTYTPDPTGAQLYEGTLDGAARDTYFAVMIVGSQLLGRGDPQQVRAESNRAHINGAIVTVTDPEGGVIGEFTSSTSGFADTALATTPAYSAVGATLIDAPTKQKIVGGLGPAGTRLVIARVKLFGETLGGVDIESGEFEFPIRVCNGCLIAFTTDDPATPNRECNLPSGEGQAQNVRPCFPGQDEVTPCFTCLERDACKQ